MDLGWAIGTVAAKWVIKLWSKDDPMVELGAEIGDVLARTARDAAGRRRASNQLNMIAELVNERIEPLLSAEVPGIEANERTAAVLAASRALTNGLSLPASFSAGLDSAILAADIRDSDRTAHTSDLLSPSAESVYETIISEATAYALHLATKLPAFALESTRLMISQTKAISNLVEKILTEIPESRVPTSWGTGTDFQRFESKFMRAIFEQSNRLRLYGINGASGQKPYALSTAYIPLQAVRDAATDNGEDANVSIEEALQLSRRLLISGDAGSGKTTLLQWITITASKASFPETLSDLNGCIPFVLPLRRFSEGDFPAPEQWPTHISPSIAGAMPEMWMHNILEEGRALILVDGFDEVPDDRRVDSIAWLEDLERNYPENLFVLTSRDVAVERSWTRGTAYARVRLLPMEYGQIRTFVDHWHDAAEQSDNTIENARAISMARVALLAALRDRPSLRALADSPLLCALICAMNLDGGSQLPSDRMELYGTALQMLVTRRDRDRRIASEITDLNFGDASFLLEEVAHWMQDNRLADCSFGEFSDRIESVLPRLHRVHQGAEEIARHLLERSGVLREPVVGRVEFIHRTFLEFLAARAAIASNSIGKLIHSASDDYWREVVILAAGHASPTAREALLRGIIDRGAKEPDHKHLLFLIAVACMETSSELAPELLKDLNACLAEVIPPRNMTDATAIAAAGDMAVPMLARRPRFALEAAAAVRSLCLIGSDAALAALRNYASDGRLTVARQVIRGWSDFDTALYATEVLSQSPLERGAITITEPEFALQAHKLTKAENISFVLPGSKVLTKLQPNDAVRRLDAPGAQNIENLEWTNGFANLRRLVLLDSSLTNLQGAERLLELGTLDIESTHVSDLRHLQDLSSLTWLDVASTPIRSLVGVPSSLDYLRLNGCASLTGSDGLQRVRSLILSSSELAALSSFIAESPDLRQIRISGDDLDLDPIPIGQGVSELQLSGFGRVSQLPAGSEALEKVGVIADEFLPNWDHTFASQANLSTLSISSHARIAGLDKSVERWLDMPSIVQIRVSVSAGLGDDPLPEDSRFRKTGRGRIVSYLRL